MHPNHAQPQPVSTAVVTVHTSTPDGEAFAASLASLHTAGNHDTRTVTFDEDGYCEPCTATVVRRYPEITDDSGENLTEDARIALLAVPRIDAGRGVGHAA